jgi:hypothetical protein
MAHRPRFDKFFELLLLVSGIIFMQLLVVLCIDVAGYNCLLLAVWRDYRCLRKDDQ